MRKTLLCARENEKEEERKKKRRGEKGRRKKKRREKLEIDYRESKSNYSVSSEAIRFAFQSQFPLL